MIEFKNVYKEYPNGSVVLRDINFKIADGEFVFIIGASGAGKTTITKLLLREEEVTRGKIVVGNYDLTKIKNNDIPKYRRNLGYVFQDFRLFPNMTVFDNIAFAMRVIGKTNSKIKEMVPAMLQTIGMSGKARSYPHELSGGEQQRVSLARAIVNNPKIVIADEPTGNLDPKMSYEILELLERINNIKINNVGKTVIVITHEKALVDYFKKRVITIKRGSIINDDIGGGYMYRKRDIMSLNPSFSRNNRNDRDGIDGMENKNDADNTETEINSRYYLPATHKSGITGRVDRIDRIDRIDRPKR